MSTNPENTKIIIIDNKKYQVITGVEEYHAEYISDAFLSMSQALLMTVKGLVYANYDGFPVRAGDLVITTWTMIRPA